MRKKYSVKPADQITSHLPHDTINQTPPFFKSGIDFAGAIYVKEGNKAYIVPPPVPVQRNGKTI